MANKRRSLMTEQNVPPRDESLCFKLTSTDVAAAKAKAKTTALIATKAAALAANDKDKVFGATSATDDAKAAKALAADAAKYPFSVTLSLGDEGDFLDKGSEPRILKRAKSLFKKRGQRWKDLATMLESLQDANPKTVKALHAALTKLGNVKLVGQLIWTASHGWELEINLG